MKENIGIVVIGRNEGERLVKCLQSIKSIGIYTVYVDSQSTDNSVKAAKVFDIPTVVLDASHPMNASRARNAGFKKLISDCPDLEYVHFIDADCELHAEWLNHAIMALDASPQIAVVCGRLHEKFKHKNIYTRLCDMDWYVETGEINACGGIATVKRCVFEEMQGFNEKLIAGADPELYFRIRKKDYKILCIPFDMGTHDSNIDFFSQYWKRSIKTGYAYVSNMNLGVAKKPVFSALLWGALIPVIIGLLMICIDPIFSLLCLMYPLQMIKIYGKSGALPFSRYSKIIYSIFCVIEKFPESIGVMKYYINFIVKHEQSIIEYKKTL